MTEYLELPKAHWFGHYLRRQVFLYRYSIMLTIIFPSFWTDRSGQTMQTMIRLFTNCITVFCGVFFVFVFSLNDFIEFAFEPRLEKTNILVSELVRHKPGCTTTEDG